MDVTAFGELLVDFTCSGISTQGNPLYEANPGGAPCNVLAMLQNLGKETAFIGKIGQDSFGHMLETAVREQGISTAGICYDTKVHTTLAFVQTASDGERDFSFYRNPGADMKLRNEEIKGELLRNTKIFHFGSLSMTHPDVEEATCYAVKEAKKNGALISFDPNLRPPLWENMETAKEKISFGLSQCDILKISEEEIFFMTGEADVDLGVKKILEEYKIPFLCATMGKHGSKAFFEGKTAEGRAFLQENTIETTGAGDTFCGCMLNFILENGIHGRTEKEVSGMLEFANAAASIITTRKGALRVMPQRKEIEDVLKTK